MTNEKIEQAAKELLVNIAIEARLNVLNYSSEVLEAAGKLQSALKIHDIHELIREFTDDPPDERLTQRDGAQYEADPENDWVGERNHIDPNTLPVEDD
jgi:hypothetical protein